jgi:hypothetical protein
MATAKLLAHHEAHVVALVLVFGPWIAQGDDQVEGVCSHPSRGVTALLSPGRR